MMKALLVTAVGAVLLASGGTNAVKGEQVEAPAQKATFSHYSEGYHYNYNASVADDITQLTEYSIVAGKIDLTKYNPQIVEDHFNKRIIVFKDVNGREQFKSMFIKEESRLKIVDYKGGLIYNQVIGEDTSEKTQTDQLPSKQTVSDEIAQLPEYKTLSTKTDLSGYGVQTVEDNFSKRILLFKDGNGHAQYKTIFMKKTSIVKVINL